MTFNFVSSSLDSITNVPTNKFCVIVCNDSIKRKKIHKYLENKHPQLQKLSLYCGRFPSKIKMHYIKCINCKLNRVPLPNYRSGMLENNEDEKTPQSGVIKTPLGVETISGTCPRCGYVTSVDRDSNELFRLFENNIIVVGHEFNGTIKHPELTNVTKSEMQSLCYLLDMYLLDVPRKIRIRRPHSLQKYINKILRK